MCCIKGSTISSEEDNLNIICAHVEPACQHIGLCIQFTALVLDIIIITQLIGDYVTQKADFVHYIKNAVT